MLNNIPMDAPAKIHLHERIRRVHTRLMREDSEQRQKLKQRLNRLQQRSRASGLANQRLQNVNRLLSNENQDPAKREKLMKRKVMLERKVAAQQERKGVTVTEGNNDGDGPSNGGRKCLTLDQRIKRAENLLSQNIARRAKIEERLLFLKQKKNEQKNRTARSNIQQRLNRIQARLDGEDVNPEHREELQERVFFLKKRLESTKQTRRANVELRLKRQEVVLQNQKLHPVRRKQVERRVAQLVAKLANLDKKLGSVRESDKKRLIGMEQRARSEMGNEMSLARIALQQIYVAHFPVENEEYVSVFSNKIKKKAALRERALEGARSEAGANWITSDQYERLPQFWSLDQELEMFGNNKSASATSALMDKIPTREMI